MQDKCSTFLILVRTLWQKNTKAWTGSRWSVCFCYLLFQDSVGWDKILQCTFQKRQNRRRWVNKKTKTKKSILQQTYFDRRQCQHLTGTRLHLFTDRRQDFSCQLSGSAMYFSGTKNIRNSSRRTLMCQHILMLCIFFFFIIIFLSLNWAAKVHEPLLACDALMLRAVRGRVGEERSRSGLCVTKRRHRGDWHGWCTRCHMGCLKITLKLTPKGFFCCCYLALFEF